VLTTAEYFRRFDAADDREACGDAAPEDAVCTLRESKRCPAVVRIRSEPTTSNASPGSFPKVQVLTAGKNVAKAPAPVVFKSAAKPQMKQKL